jgi:hypothetical protein
MLGYTVPRQDPTVLGRQRLCLDLEDRCEQIRGAHRPVPPVASELALGAKARCPAARLHEYNHRSRTAIGNRPPITR